MIKYKIDIISALKDHGYSTYRIKCEKIFNQTQMQNLRNNKLLTEKSLDKLCHILDCQPGDIIEYIPDNDDKSDKY